MLPQIKTTNFIEEQSPMIQEKLVCIRNLILDTHPMLQENYSPSLPYYSVNGLLCTVLVKKGNIIISFSNGAQLAENHPALEGAGLKIREYRIMKGEEIRVKELEQLLKAAVRLNLLA